MEKGVATPETMAIDAMYKLYTNEADMKVIKEKGLVILDAFKVKGGVHEHKPFDADKQGEWFLGQIYSSLQSGNARDFNNLVRYSKRYNSKEFFGKEMHGVFGVAEAGHEYEKRQFELLYPDKADWLDANKEPHSKLFGNYPDHKTLEGRRMAFWVPGDFPDLPGKKVEGTLVVDKESYRSSVYKIQTRDEGIVEVDFNNVKCKIKDTSMPPYRQITEDAKQNGYVEADYGYEFKQGESLRWIVPDKDSGVWNQKNAVVVRPRERSSALYTVRVGEDVYQLNTNTFFSEGNRMLVKKG